MTSAELLLKIEKFNELLSDFGIANFNSKALWQMKNEILEHFKATSFEDGGEKQLSLSYFQTLVDELKEKQETVLQENEKFASDAELSIAEIKELIKDGFYINNPEKESIAQLKGLIEKAFDYFKHTRWPSKERRTQAWEEFNQLREKIKKEEDEFYINLREKRAEWTESSHQLSQIVIETIEACHPDVLSNSLTELLGQLATFLNSTGINGESVAFLSEKQEENSKNLLKPKSETLRDIKKFITEIRDDLTREDKARIFARIEAINIELNKAWDVYRENLQKKQEEWEERKKQNEFKRAEWLVKQNDFLKVLEEKLEKRIADKANLERILVNKQEFHGRQKSRLENQLEFLKKITGDLEDMKEKLETAWSDNFREKMLEKVEQKKQKIDEVNKDVAIVTAKSEEVEKDIADITEKLTTIEKSLEELKLKIEEVRKNLE